MGPRDTRSALDFDALYRGDVDPWEVDTSWYEHRKLALTLACLRRERYAVAWDAASGTGHLAQALSHRVETMWATDASAEAVALTGRRCGERVITQVNRLPAAPPGLIQPDLIVLSEVLYYLDSTERDATAQVIAQVVHPKGDIVAVHWRGVPEFADTDGATAQRDVNAVLVEAGFDRVVTHTDPEFVIAVWSRDLPGELGR